MQKTYYSFGNSQGCGTINEDVYLNSSESGIFAVFDGIGGYIDSLKSAKTARKHIAHTAPLLPKITRRTPYCAQSWFHYALASAHAEIKVFLTTASVVALCKNHIMTVNIGNSRVWGYNNSNKALTQLTKDGAIYPFRPRSNCVSLSELDGVLLTTDGMDNLSPEEIAEIVITNHSIPQAVVEGLIASAYDRSCTISHPRSVIDDITAVYVNLKPN